MIGKFTHDKIGIWSSILCIVHCLAVPVVLALSNGYDLHDKFWWDLVQIGFILIGFWAVRHAVSHVRLPWLKVSFWITFGLLVLSMILHHSLLGEILNYSAATGLVVLHSLNLYLSRNKKPIIA